jgi:hypothetical protein
MPGAPHLAPFEMWVSGVGGWPILPRSWRRVGLLTLVYRRKKQRAKPATRWS